MTLRCVIDFVRIGVHTAFVVAGSLTVLLFVALWTLLQFFDESSTR